MFDLNQHINQIIEEAIAPLKEELQQQKKIILDLTNNKVESEYITFEELINEFGFNKKTLYRLRKEQNWIVEMKNGKGTPFFNRKEIIKKLQQREKKKVNPKK